MNQKNATNKIETQVGEREIVITRVFDAPRDLVFDAWTKEEHLSKWWGPRGFTTSFQKFDMKPGGTWQFIMHGPDGVIILTPTSLSRSLNPSKSSSNMLCFLIFWRQQDLKISMVRPNSFIAQFLKKMPLYSIR